jgi:hypothetical protein
MECSRRHKRRNLPVARNKNDCQQRAELFSSFTNFPSQRPFEHEKAILIFWSSALYDAVGFSAYSYLHGSTCVGKKALPLPFPSFYPTTYIPIVSSRIGGSALSLSCQLGCIQMCSLPPNMPIRVCHVDNSSISTVHLPHLAQVP